MHNNAKRKDLMQFVSGNRSNLAFWIRIFSILSLPFLTSNCHLVKHAGPKYFPLESAQYLPKELAINYAKAYFDVNSEGILLRKLTRVFFLGPYKTIYRRFPFEATHLYIQVGMINRDNFKKSGSYVAHVSTVNMPRPKDFSSYTSLNKAYDDWFERAGVGDRTKRERGYEKIQKLVNALVSLGVNFNGE